MKFDDASNQAKIFSRERIRTRSGRLQTRGGDWPRDRASVVPHLKLNLTKNVRKGRLNLHKHQRYLEFFFLRIKEKNIVDNLRTTQANRTLDRHCVPRQDLAEFVPRSLSPGGPWRLCCTDEEPGARGQGRGSTHRELPRGGHPASPVASSAPPAAAVVGR